MNLKDYYQSREQLQRTVQVLLSSFNDYYYFTVNKIPNISYNKLSCNMSFVLYVPYLSNFEFHRLTLEQHLNLDTTPQTNLKLFNGFKTAGSVMTVGAKDAMFLHYPEMPFIDLDIQNEISATIVHREKKSIYETSFDDFCEHTKTIVEKNLQEIIIEDSNQIITHTFTNKEKNLLLKSYQDRLSIITKSVKKGSNLAYSNVHDISKLQENIKWIEKKIHHHELDNTLPMKHSNKRVKL